MKLQVIPLTGSIGGAVEGIDLNQPVDDATFEDAAPRFPDHCVLVFRGQRLTPAAQVAFAKRWGEPVQQNPLLKHIEGFPEMIQVTKIPKETASTEAWHYDSPYTPGPAQDLDPLGGDACRAAATPCGATSTSRTSACRR